MEAVEERVCDQPVLKLLRAMLRAGVMEDGQVRRPVTGTPQGGVISAPSCATSTCTGWTGHGTTADGVLVRYADDLVVMCRSRSQAEAALERLTALLAELGLEPKAAKTRHRAPGGGRRGVWTSSASTTGWCGRGDRPGNAVIVSLPAGPRTRPCSMPATGSGR